jgi:hypothetical protein
MVTCAKPEETNPLLRVDQANVFYNYTIGFESTCIDLVKTAGKLLKTGIARAVFFSDFKCLYMDTEAKVQLEWIHPQGRQWDSSWKINFGPEVPVNVAEELIFAIEMSFHEQRIEGCEVRQIAPYLRASLPPIVLESDDLTLPIYASVKLFSDGIAILSFQLDSTWDGVDEQYFISNIVNLYQRYFRSIWVDSRIQRLDAEGLLPIAFQDQLSIVGNTLGSWKVKRLLRKMRMESWQLLNKALDEQGSLFDVGNEKFVLHEIVGSKDDDLWESTIDLCRSEYTNALCRLVVPSRDNRKLRAWPAFMWQGRPCVSLMRFREQPATKIDLLARFASSFSRILMRTPAVDTPSDLPPDLRPFGDYCFYGNRSVLLWAWLRPEDSPANAWDDLETRAALTENQTRSEHVEYHNMRIARACNWAQSPPSDGHLSEAYETLAFAENGIHHSSQAGEISEALSYLLVEFGTLNLVSSGKEAARWHLDKLRYKSDRRRNRTNSLLSFVFGLVGTAGLADLVIRPSLVTVWPHLSSETAPIAAFGVAGLIVLLIASLIWFFNRMESDD